MKTEIRASVPIWSDVIELLIRVTPDHGGPAFAQPLTLCTPKEGEAVYQPTLSISRSDAQQWIDELWRVGLRPSEGSGSAGSLAATERHLADMRDVAFGALVKAGIHSGGKS